MSAIPVSVLSHWVFTALCAMINALIKLTASSAALAHQTARAAALLQRLTASGQGGNPPQAASAVQMAQHPAWPPAAAPKPLLIPDGSDAVNPISPTESGLNPTDFPGASGFNPLGVTGFGIPGALGFGDGMLSPGGFNSGGQAGMQLSSSAAGLESGQSSTANNQSGAVSEGTAGGLSGSGFAALGPAAGAALASLTSPEAVYGSDGLDVPGTAQVGGLGLLGMALSSVLVCRHHVPPAVLVLSCQQWLQDTS